MKKSQTIKRLLAFFLLLLFVLSITPQHYWHHCLAHDGTEASAATQIPGDKIDHVSYPCHGNELVAHSFFEGMDTPFAIQLQEIIMVQPVLEPVAALTQNTNTRSTRGPPAAAFC